MFLRSGYPIGQPRTIHDLAGSGNSKMAAFKPEVCVYIFLVNMIGTQFHWLCPCFWGQATRRDKWQYCPMYGYVKNQRWRPITGSIFIRFVSASTHVNNEIPMV